jgi:hypothetical protein
MLLYINTTFPLTVSSIDGHFGYFKFLAIINNTAINVGIISYSLNTEDNSLNHYKIYLKIMISTKSLNL